MTGPLFLVMTYYNIQINYADIDEKKLILRFYEYIQFTVLRDSTILLVLAGNTFSGLGGWGPNLRVSKENAFSIFGEHIFRVSAGKFVFAGFGKTQFLRVLAENVFLGFGGKPRFMDFGGKNSFSGF